MDALHKQASKLREQVAKQQQAVIKQFSTSGYESSDVIVIDEVEMQRHQQLEKLYRSTCAGKVIASLANLVYLKDEFQQYWVCLVWNFDHGKSS